jgi:hypothetical protein
MDEEHPVGCPPGVVIDHRVHVFVADLDLFVAMVEESLTWRLRSSTTAASTCEWP